MQKKSNAVLKKIFTVPNILSFFRLCLIPVIVWLYCVRKNYPWTGAVIILSGATDIIDGFIARHFNMVSDVGKILDPIADKCTQMAVIICLVIRFPLMLLPLSFMVVKEVFVGITGLIAVRRSGNVPSADWHGKTATVLLYLMMMTHVFWYNITKPVSCTLIIASTIMIGVSFVLYGTANIRVIKHSPKKHSRAYNSENAAESIPASDTSDIDQ